MQLNDTSTEELVQELLLRAKHTNGLEFVGSDDLLVLIALCTKQVAINVEEAHDEMIDLRDRLGMYTRGF